MVSHLPICIALHCPKTGITMHLRCILICDAASCSKALQSAAVHRRATKTARIIRYLLKSWIILYKQYWIILNIDRVRLCRFFRSRWGSEVDHIPKIKRQVRPCPAASRWHLQIPPVWIRLNQFGASHRIAPCLVSWLCNTIIGAVQLSLFDGLCMHIYMVYVCMHVFLLWWVFYIFAAYFGTVCMYTFVGNSGNRIIWMFIGLKSIEGRAGPT